MWREKGIKNRFLLETESAASDRSSSFPSGASTRRGRPTEDKETKMGSVKVTPKTLLVDLDGTLYRSAQLFEDVKDRINE